MLHAWPSIQYREDTEDYLVLLPAKLERLAAKNTRLRLRLGPVSFVNPLMVD